MNSAVSETSFSVKTAVFEGPLELLLDLVEKRKLLINDISLAAVTDEYMKSVREMQELSLPNTAQFISLAATLLLVKSKSLLPVIELTEEEETSIEDLEVRLKQYQVFRDASIKLQEEFGKNILYAPKFILVREPVFIADLWCSIPELHRAIFSVLKDLPKKEPVVKVQLKTVISLEQMMINLQTRINSSLKIKFTEMNIGENDKKVIILSFLAILELFKQGNLIISQIEIFSDIEIELDKGHTPKYY